MTARAPRRARARGDVARVERLEDLKPDPQNANRGTKRGVELLEESLKSYGAGRSIVAARDGTVLGGNKTLAAAVEMGLGVTVVRSDGKNLVVVLREDLEPGSKEARALALADNRVAEVGLDWDAAEIAALVNDGVPVDKFFFPEELKKLLGQVDAPGAFPAADPKTEHKCPKCGFRF